MSIRQILHVDLDAFFASVEQLDFPSYRGKPVIVGGLPGDRRSVVSTASYEARKYGVHSAMPTAKAYQLCPQGIFVRGRMERYCQLSHQIMNIFRDFSPDVQQMSIDEAFIDLTGTEKLFGSPENTARRIKERVLEETGLTVSVGLATNKYLAKIASGMDKPDGLFVIPPGGEERFMLSLPLDKLWGVGNKSRKALNDRGFYTTKEIHNASLAGLTQIFGDCTGMFLYQAVRGQEAAGFDEEPKSHSISNETTFSFDLTDRDIILTALMNLCYTVYFRLLADGFCSKTVHLKIRYEDFSTVSIQETLPRYISSTDDFYERIVHLFDVKYDRTKGIRLLGVGCQNLQNGTTGEQQELFDFGEGKKRALETAVLELQQKDPKNLVKKARQFLSCLLIAGCLVCHPFQTVSAEDSVVDKPAVNRSDVEFFTEGYWESAIASTGSAVFRKKQNPSVQFTPMVYTQKADLTVWFLYRDHWFFEAGFADDFSDNTVAAGYYGDDIIKEIRIGNGGITFPSHKALETLGYSTGTENMQTPGVMASFGGDRWTADAMIRFEQIESCSQSWQGSNIIVHSDRELSDWVQNRYFILPEASLVQHVQSLWGVSADGSLNRISDSQYLLIPGTGQIIIADNVITGGLQTILAELDETGCSRIRVLWDDLKDDIAGTFGDFYDENPEAFDIASPPFRNGRYLYLQKAGMFSPFADASRYRNPATGDGQIANVISAITGTVDQRYTVNLYDEEYSFLQVQPVRTVFDADQRYPFADTCPELYVTGHRSVTSAVTGKILQVQTSEPDGSYNIGTKAIGGTVLVRKNGVPVTAQYNSFTGDIILDSTPGPYDQITVTWNEPSGTSGNPVLHTTAGTALQLNDNLYVDTATSLLWPWVTDISCSTPDAQQTGSATVAGYAAWDSSSDNQTLSLESATGLTFSVSDVTGHLRIEGFDDSSTSALLLGQESIGQPEEGSITIKTVRATQSPRSGYENTLYWDSGNRLEIPLTFSSGGSLVKNAQFIHLWVKGNLSSNVDSVLFQGGLDYQFEENLTSSLNDNQWHRITLSLNDADRRLLSETPEFRLLITSSDGESTSGEFTLCGDSLGLAGLRYHADTVNASSYTVETGVPPTALPASVNWLSPTVPLRALEYRITTGTAGVAATLTSEDFLSPMNLSSYDEMTCQLMVAEGTACQPEVTVALLSDTDEVLVTMTGSAADFSGHEGHWITVAHTLSAAEKAMLKNNPPVKRRITITIPSEKVTGNDRITVWYDELTAHGISSDLMLRNVTTARYTLENMLFLKDTAITASTDSAVSPADGWQGAMTASGDLTTTLPVFQVQTGATFHLADNTVNLKEVEYTVKSAPDSVLTPYVNIFSRYQLDLDTDKTVRRDTATLTVPADAVHLLMQTGYTADFSNTLTSWQQNATAYSQITYGKTMPVTIRLSGSATQQVPEKPGTNWSDTLLLEFSTGEEKASNRTENLQGTLRLEIPPLSLKPEIQIRAASRIQSSSAKAVNSLQSRLSVPFTVNRHSWNLFLKEESTLEKKQPADATWYGSDIQQLSADVPQLGVTHLNVPFAGSETALLKIQQQIPSDSVYGLKETTGFSWSRPSSFTAMDLFIPVKGEAELGTVNRVSSLSRTQSFSGKGTLTFNAYNCLGSDSSRPLFTFYTQDETLTTLSVGYEDLRWFTHAITSETLFFASDSQFNLISSFDWTEKKAYTLEETVSLNHHSKGSEGRPGFTHEEQCSLLYTKPDESTGDSVESRIQIRHKTTAAISDALTATGTIQSWWNHTDSAETIGFTTTLSARLSY